MNLKILGTESLGVRGLSCVVEARDRKIVIDPGLALGFHRYGLFPHPAQVAVGEQIRQDILAELEDATDVVLSHFHGDHVPLPDANPYQLKAQEAAPLFQSVRLWAQGDRGALGPHALPKGNARRGVGESDSKLGGARRRDARVLPRPCRTATPDTKLGTVMMTRIRSEDTVFVHASDIQLLDDEPISLILDWRPDIVLASGPPLYITILSSEDRETAWNNARRLALGVETLILDHHLLRCEEGLSWLDRLSSRDGTSRPLRRRFYGTPRGSCLRQDGRRCTKRCRYPRAGMKRMRVGKLIRVGIGSL